MAIWSLKPSDDRLVEKLSRSTNLPPAIARALAIRGYDDPVTLARFRQSRENLGYLRNLPVTAGLERAVARIRRAIAGQELIVIYGDYDCDGVTSASLLYRYFTRGLGARVEAFLPNRFRDGYGVTPHAVDRLAARGVKLIVTCDNGISAHAAANRARECGIDLIVTDHHQIPEELPECHAIVHPGLDLRDLKDLAGVGVAMLLVIALEGGFTARLEPLLDLVTIGTVADMVPLDGPNRPLVWTGLERYRTSRGSPIVGIPALAEVAGSKWETFGAQDIGFGFGPRLNAAGRLEDPDVGFKLLTTNDRAEANALARQLEDINRDRRTLNAELEAQVLAELDRRWDPDAEPFIVYADERLHHGVAGIVAGRIKERYRVPVLLFSTHGGSDLWKASGRSPEGLHLYEALNHARAHLVGFGGHAQAAGCSAMGEQIDALRAKLAEYVRLTGWTRPEDRVDLDAELPFAQANPTLLTALDQLEPFGQKNPPPRFGLLGARVVSREVFKDRHLRLRLEDGVQVRELVAWNAAGQADALEGWVNVAYSVRPPWKRGASDVDCIVDRVEPTQAPSPVVIPPREAEIVDLRAQAASEVHLGDPLVLGPGSAVPDSVAGRHCVLVGPPPSEAVWHAWRMSAERIVLREPETELEESPLTPDELERVYAALAERPGLPLDEARSALGWSNHYRWEEALAILRESRLLVVERERWWLLMPPHGVVGMGALEAYRNHLAAASFRQRW
ncbi:MAG: single-stranded-DNA-specific exonuclease RecJ [bacterium]|nr:single-stranded-DNA-specific exonuclease RecJ [bacterium]